MPNYNTNGKLELMSYNYDTHLTESKGEVSLYLIAKNMKDNALCSIIDDWLNGASNPFGHGEAMGKLFQGTHRTLQGMIVNWALGILCGISEQNYTDARNERAVAIAQRVKQLVKEEGLQPLI